MSDVRARAIHAHPFSILTFLYRFLFLLIIPLARGFISALTGDIFSWVRGAWFDILIVALIIILAYQKWEHFQYHMDINGVYIATGIFFRSEFYIPQDRISTLSVIRPFWLRPFRIARIRIDTIAGDPRSPDAAFYVWSREADRISSLRAAPPAMDSDGAPAQDRPHLYELVLLSLLTSNSFIGIV
ncbi:MAG: PH domain-containing protein, partial [Anaerotruncus colihominis]